MLYKFIDEGRQEHEEMGAFIREFKTTNELLLKERNNSLRELKFEVYGLSKAINDALWAFRTAYRTPTGCTPDCVVVWLYLSNSISTVAYRNGVKYLGIGIKPMYRTPVTTIVEALICTQDWVRKSRTQINWDDVEDLIKDDEIVKDMEEQLEKLTERDKAKQTGEI
ncbi:hypothetical protein Tco_0671932 [Tanacetum coccineum]